MIGGMPPVDAAQFSPPGTSAPTLISVAAGTLTPPNGRPVPYSATEMPQYLDAPLAGGWFRYARDLAHDDALLARLETASAVEQAKYFFDILSALANGYNALNILWYNHPQARAIYRSRIAGNPQGREQVQLDAQFSNGTFNYREGWYGAAYPWPQIPNAEQQRRDADSGNSPLTGLPLAARTVFDRYYASEAGALIQWVQLCGLYVDTIDREIANPRDVPDGVNYAENVRNRAFAMLPSRGGEILWTDGPEQDPYLRFGDEAVVQERFKRAVMFGGVGYDALPMPPTGVFIDPTNGNRLSIEVANMRAFAYDERLSIVRVPLKVSNALIEYLGWLREWTTACVAQSPTEIAIASRYYVTWQNGETARGMSGIVNEIVNRDAEIARDRSTPDPVATAVFRSMAAVAPVFATAGPWGAAIGLGITAAAAIGQVITSIVGSGVSARRKRNDLGEFKPVFQRAAASGSLLHNRPPVLQIPAPPGWRRPADAADRLRRMNLTCAQWFAMDRPAQVAALTPVLDGEDFNATYTAITNQCLVDATTAVRPPLDGAAILRAIGTDAAGWRALGVAQQNAALNAVGFRGDAAVAAARQAVLFYVDPSSRPGLSLTGGGSTSTMLVAGAAAAAALWWLARGKR